MRFMANICSFILMLSIKFVLPFSIALFWLDFFLPLSSSSSSSLSETTNGDLKTEEEMLVIVKIGGSSITIKSQYETLNDTSLEWMTNVLKDSLHDRFLAPSEISPSMSEENEGEKEREKCKKEGECLNVDSIEKKKVSMVVIHGAGSFGHHTAKQYGLVGRTTPPRTSQKIQPSSDETKEEEEHKYAVQGIVKARHSVQKLNSHILSSVLSHNINAINISPCWSIPNLQSHGGGLSNKKEENGITDLIKSIKQALKKGIVPILHGDACPYGTATGRDGVGILSGDTLVEAITTQWNDDNDPTHSSNYKQISHVVFITDIDKVYTADPKIDANAKPLDVIEIDVTSGDVVINEKEDDLSIDAGESSHDHDVTGGLKTKLGAAASIAREGINVHIVQCGSKSAEHAILGKDDNGGTLVRLQQ